MTRENSDNGKSEGPRPQNNPATPQTPATPQMVLRELFDLLEDYGPSWYTEEHHRRAVAALRQREHQGAA